VGIACKSRYQARFRFQREAILGGDGFGDRIDELADFVAGCVAMVDQDQRMIGVDAGIAQGFSFPSQGFDYASCAELDLAVGH